MTDPAKATRGLIVGALACAACLGAGAAEPIRIGFFMSMTGRDASFGEASMKGALMGIDSVNASGGVLGRKVELVTEDNRSLPGESATAVKKLISRDHVAALIGECSSARSLEAAPVAQAAGVPMVTPASTNASVTEAGNCIFRMCFVDSFQGEVIATFARKRLGLRRAAILIDATAPYSVGLAEYFSRTFRDLGGEVVSSQRYSGADTDFRAQLTAIRAAGPDALFLPGYYVAAGLVARQSRELGLASTLLGGDAFEAPQLLEIGGDALNGAYYSTHFATENTSESSRGFVEAFQGRFGTLPNGLAALTYDSVRLVADAIRRAGTTERGALRGALAATKEFPGVTGTTTFDAHRNAVKDAAIIAVRGGRLVFVETIRP